MSDKIWIWSEEEESWCGSIEFATKEEAIADGRKEMDGPFYVGTKEPFKAPMFDAQDILERLGEVAYEEVGEVAECWPDASKEDVQLLQKELDAMIEAWMKDTGNHPNFFVVKNVERVDVQQ